MLWSSHTLSVPEVVVSHDTARSHRRKIPSPSIPRVFPRQNQSVERCLPSSSPVETSAAEQQNQHDDENDQGCGVHCPSSLEPCEQMSLNLDQCTAQALPPSLHCAFVLALRPLLPLAPSSSGLLARSHSACNGARAQVLLSSGVSQWCIAISVPSETCAFGVCKVLIIEGKAGREGQGKP